MRPIGDTGAQHVGDMAQHRIAGQMAPAVVDLFEVVHVQQQQGQRPGRAATEVQQGGAVGQHRPTVEQAGQHVGARQSLQVDQHALHQQQHQCEAARQLQDQPDQIGRKHRRPRAHDVLACIRRHRQEQTHQVQQGLCGEHRRRQPATGALRRRCMPQQQPRHPAIEQHREHAEHMQPDDQAGMDHQEKGDGTEVGGRQRHGLPRRQAMTKMARYAIQHQYAGQRHRNIAREDAGDLGQVRPQRDQGQADRQHPQAGRPQPQRRLPTQHQQQQRETHRDAQAQQEAEHGDGGEIQGHRVSQAEAGRGASYRPTRRGAARPHTGWCRRAAVCRTQRADAREFSDSLHSGPPFAPGD